MTSSCNVPCPCTLQAASLQRSIAVAVKVVPRIPALDEDVARLQKALLEARREAEALSVALENPGNQSRWRLLEGKIPGARPGT